MNSYTIQDIKDIIERVSEQIEGTFERYESSDGRGIEFSCVSNEDYGYNEVQIMSDDGHVFLNESEVERYMDDSFVLVGDEFEDIFEIDNYETVYSDELKQTDIHEEAYDVTTPEWEDLNDAASNTDTEVKIDILTDEPDNDLYKHENITTDETFENSSTDLSVEDLPEGEDINELLADTDENEKMQTEPIQIKELDDAINNYTSSFSKNGNDNENNRPDGMTITETIELKSSQLRAGFIPFEARTGFQGQEGKIPQEIIQEARDKGIEVGKILGNIDTSEFLTKKDSPDNFNMSVIKIPYSEVKELLTDSAQKDDKFKESNIESVKCYKQFGETVDVQGFRKDGESIKIGVTNLVTIDVEFKDKSHLEKTLVVDDLGNVRGVFDFQIDQFDGTEKNIELPIKELKFDEEAGRFVLPDIPSLDRSNPDNPSSFVKHLDTNGQCDFVDAAIRQIENFIADKLDSYQDDIEQKRGLFDGRIEDAKQNVDIARGDVGKAELVMLSAGGQTLSVIDKLESALEKYNEAVEARKNSDLDSNSDEYKELINKESSAKEAFLKAYEEASVKIKEINVSDKFETFDRTVDKYNEALSRYDKEVTAKDAMFGKNENVAGSLERTSWSEKLVDGKQVDNNQSFAMLCKAESQRVDKTASDFLSTDFRDSEVDLQKDFDKLIQDYNDTSDEKDRMQLHEDGTPYDLFGNKVPIESTQDANVIYYEDKLDFNQVDETDEYGNSIEKTQAPTTEATLDSEDPRAKFLESVKSGFSRDNIENLRTEMLDDKTERFINSKATALDDTEKEKLKTEISIIREDIESGQPVDYESIEERTQEKLESTNPNETVSNDNHGKSDTDNSKQHDFDTEFKRNLAGTYSRVVVDSTPKLTDLEKKDISKKAQDEAKIEAESKIKEKYHIETIDYKTLSKEFGKEYANSIIEEYKDLMYEKKNELVNTYTKDIIQNHIDNGDCIRQVRISDSKMNDLKEEAHREARAEARVQSRETGEDYDKLVVEKYEKILDEKKSELTNQLNAIRNDIVTFKTHMDKIELPGRFVSKHMGYQVLCNEFDAAVKKYQDLGGAIGKGEFVEKGVSGLERFCGFLDIMNTNILETLILNICLPGETIGVAEIFSGKEVYAPITTTLTGLVGVGTENAISFIPRLAVEGSKELIENLKASRVEKIEEKMEKINESDKDTKNIDTELNNDLESSNRDTVTDETKTDIENNNAEQNVESKNLEKTEENNDKTTKEEDKDKENVTTTEKNEEDLDKTEQNTLNNEIASEENENTDKKVAAMLEDGEDLEPKDQLESSESQEISSNDKTDEDNDNEEDNVETKDDNHQDDEEDEKNNVENEQEVLSEDFTDDLSQPINGDNMDETVQNDDIVDQFKEKLESVLNGDESFEDAISKFEDGFADGLISDEIIPDIFASAVRTTGIEDMQVISDVATDLANISNSPVDSMLEKFGDAIETIANTSETLNDFSSEEMLGNATETLVSNPPEIEAAGTDGLIEYTDEFEPVDIVTIEDNSEDIVQDITNNEQDFLQDIDSAMTTPDEIQNPEGIVFDENKDVDTNNDLVDLDNSFDNSSDFIDDTEEAIETLASLL